MNEKAKEAHRETVMKTVATSVLPVPVVNSSATSRMARARSEGRADSATAMISKAASEVRNSAVAAVSNGALPVTSRTRKETLTMRIKIFGIALIMALTASAQKEFTLEDLNFGGKNYKAMSPENRDYSWWGNQLVRKEDDKLFIVSTKDNAEKPFTEQQQKQYDEWKEQKKELATTEDHNILVDGKQITTDGSRDIVYGEAVHRNEWGIMGGLFWSPDKKRLAFYRMDQSMVADYPQVNISGRIATLEPDKYPMAGETSHVVTVGIYDLKTQKTIYLKTAVAETDDYQPVYFTNIAWSPDSKTLFMFELNRDQNDCRLVSYSAETGEKLQELYRETSDKYVEPMHPIEFLPWDASSFIMQSQKDGYNHLYLCKLKNNRLTMKQLTSGKWVVMEMLGFNARQKSIIIASNEASPIQRNLYAVSQTGKRTLLDNGIGWHSGKLSENGEMIIDTWSAPDTPRGISLLSSAKNSSVTLFNAKNPWEGYKIPIYECGTLKAADGKTDLYYRMVKPADFDASKKYPTVIYVYGGPHAHNVDARWHYGSRSWETYMAQKGYVLFILDNRGSENRGREFEQVTFRQLGQIEMKDQMKGVEFLRTLPYVDTERLGVHGWSFGGFMTISLMTNYPDVFKVGVAGGPVIDWKWYEVMYGERYMDTPQDNPEGYEKTSLLPKAKDLKGKLQIITGYNDETVVPQHCLSFMAECIKAGTQPDFFAYPGEPHNMRGHQSVHLHERITQYFEDYLK